MVGDKYVPNLPSFDDGFPSEMPAPALLRDFAAWLADKPRSSLGWFHLESAPLDAKYVGHDDATLTLRTRLGIFMVSPDGSRLALWQPDDGPPAVVRLGPNGVLSDVSPDLETFLVALAEGSTGIPALERTQRETPAVRAELATWLASRGIAHVGRSATPGGIAPSPAAHLDPGAFQRWFEATREAARTAHAATSVSRPQLTAASVSPDLFDRVDPILGLLIDDSRVQVFFESIGIHLDALRDPDELRAISRPRDGLELEIAWPWDRGSEWLEAEYPKSQRSALELRRARMFWSVTLFVVPELRAAPRNRGQLQFQPFAGKLPLGIRTNDDATSLESTLGPPVRGSEGTRIWDFPQRRRALIGAFNEGPFARTDLPRGGLKWLIWRFGQSV
jgi:hypothetical protein